MTETHILYVANSEKQRRDLVATLEKRGLSVQVCSDAAAADRIVAEHEFDLVLCENELAVQTGLVLLKQVRGHKPQLPFILLGVDPASGDGRAAIRAGASHYLCEPLDPEEVEIRIEQVRERARLMRTLEERGRELEAKTIELAQANVDLLGAQEELEQAGNQIRLIVETSPVPTIVSRLDDGKIIYANQGLARLVGQPADKLVGQLTPNFYKNLEDREKVVSALRRDGYLNDFDVELVRPSGETIWTNMSLAITKLGEDLVIIGGVSDITERKQTEEALLRARNFSTAVLDTAGALVVVLKPDGSIVRFNRACEEVSGYRAAEVLGKRFGDLFITPEEQEKLRERFALILTGKPLVRGENCWLTKSGERRLIAWSNTVLKDDSGAVEFVVAIGIDITDQRLAEEKLRLYRQLYLDSVDSMVILDSEGKYLESNAAHQRASGMSAEKLKSVDILSALGIDPDNKMREQLLEGKSCRFEIRPPASDRGARTYEVSAFPIWDESQEIVAYAGIGRDVTAQRLAQEALAARARHEEGLAACSQALLTETDTRSAIRKALQHLLEAFDASRVYLNQMAEGATDMADAALTIEVCAPGIEPQMDNPELLKESVREAFRGWEEAMAVGKHVGGIVRELPEPMRKTLEIQDIVSILVMPLMIDGKCAGMIGFDDCKRERRDSEEDIRLMRTAAEMIGGYLAAKRIEEALRVSEERFRNLVENATDVIYSIDAEGCFSYISPQFFDVTGYRPEEFIGRPVHDLQPHEHENEPHESWLVEVLSGKVDRVMGDQFTLRTKSGEVRWFVSNISVVRDDEGKFVELIGVAHDITEMKRVLEDLEHANQELRDTQSQLVQSEKMASLGQLVAGIAHEINTPIGALSSMHNTQLRAFGKLRDNLERQCAEQIEGSEKLQATLQVIDESNRVIANAAERVTTIVRRLRSFARLDEAELKNIDIHEGIEDTLTLIHHEIKHHITINREFGELPRLACYPGRLNQVFLNILNNARQAIKDKGEITITTYMRDSMAHVEFSDTGHGISRENLKRVFDPGFTTKGVGVGTGLGLSICFQIIEDHQGRIEVESELGKGTTFTVIIPTDLDKRLGIEPG